MGNDEIESLKNELLETENLQQRLVKIAEYAKERTGADRFSLFAYDRKNDQLHSIYADGMKGAIVIKSNSGIVGYAFHKKESVIENDVTSNSNFLEAVDNKSGYHTRNVLAVPIVTSDEKRHGVIQLLNKREGFNEEDRKEIEALAKILMEVLSPKKRGEKQSSPPPEEERPYTEIDRYLADKKLYFMDDGYVYYKILKMPREYYIAADKCYLLEETPKKIPLYYYSSFQELLTVEMWVKIDKSFDGLLISKGGSNYRRYPLEKDD